MTRHRTVRPLVAAWAFVIVSLMTGFIWLTVTDDTGSVARENHVEENHLAARTEPAAATEPVAIARSDDGALKTQQAAPRDIAPDFPDVDDPATAADTAGAQAAAPALTPGRASLVKAPIDGLVMIGANGPLPVLGPDSLVAWKAYARPQDISDNRPKIAIIVTGIGLNDKFSDMAITRLPGEIDLGFSPYGRKLQDWMDKAREYGHEGFLMLPAEPVKYPENDPGPHTLLSGGAIRDNLKKLDWLLSRVTGYVGVINEMGSKLTASEEDILPILDDLKGRGLMFLDSRSTRYSVAAKVARRLSMPHAFNNRFVDNRLSPDEISRNLTALENTARTYGAAVGVARALPLTLRELESWARGLEDRGFQLTPVTAIANRQPIR